MLSGCVKRHSHVGLEVDSTVITDTVCGALNLLESEVIAPITEWIAVGIFNEARFKVALAV